MDKALRLLRYNTGNDKQAFIKFKDDFDAVIFNATIVAYSGSSVSDLVSVHKNQYIVDPQTHIFQHDISAIQTLNKQGDVVIRKSVEKYINELPIELSKILLVDKRPLSIEDIVPQIDSLTNSTYVFQTEYVQSFIKKKEYDKYLEFVNVGPQPKLVIAPYFMLKSIYSTDDIASWLAINRTCLNSFIKRNNGQYEVSAQIVMDADILLKNNILDKLKETYSISGYSYIFLWIDNFDSFEADNNLRLAFSNLISMFTGIGKKVIMAYGGYDSILLCNKEIPNRLYGVAQSVGYGEARNITPVGGGLPTNKYYFFPIHRRLKFDAAANILRNRGYFSKKKSQQEYAADYYSYICDCKQCHEVIKNDIDNFDDYNDSIPFVVKGRYGDIKRNRPTTNANLIAALHFLYCKTREWDDVQNHDLAALKQQLISGYSTYLPSELNSIVAWCKQYGV